MTKIGARTLANFLGKVTINGSMTDALLKFGPDGLSVSVKDVSNTGFSSGLLKTSAGFMDYTQMNAPVKNIGKLLSFLKSVSGNVDLSISGNNLIIKSDNNDGRFKLAEEQYLECNLATFPTLEGHDAGFEVDTKVLMDAKKNALNLGFKHVFAEVKDGVFYLTAGEDEFDQLASHTKVDYKNVTRTMYATTLLEFISVIEGKARISFNDEYPMLITVTNPDSSFAWLVAPMVQQKEETQA